jgi:hypothetical protein
MVFFIQKSKEYHLVGIGSIPDGVTTNELTHHPDL